MTVAVQEFSEVAGAPLALIDTEGAVVGWTAAAQQLLGYSAEEAVNQPVGALLAPADDQARASAFTAQCRAREGWNGSATVRHRDGDLFDIDLRAFPLFGQDGSEHSLIALTDMCTVSPPAVNSLKPSSLLIRTPIGIVVRDADLRCTWVNDVAELLDGIPPDDRLGRKLAKVVPGFESDAMETVTQRVVTSGAPAIDVEYPAWLPENTRKDRSFSVSFFRLNGADGHAPGVCAIMVDVADKERARERLTKLNEASAHIGTTLDVLRTGQELADLAMSLLADVVSVELAGSIPFVGESLARLGPVDGAIPMFRRAGLATIREGNPELQFARGDVVFVRPGSPFTDVMSSGKPYFAPVLDTSPGGWLAQDKGRFGKATTYGFHSGMLVPISARGTVLGIAMLVRTWNPAPFDEGDLRLAEELVSRAALSLDNASRYTRERSAALALQRNLLPGRITGGVAVDVASRYLPADTHNGVGGDWFDVIRLSSARVALVVGDVVGHGINAAATMGTLRTAIHTLADLDLQPDEVLARLDDTVIRLSEEEHGHHDEPIGTAALGATCLYAVYDPVTRQCSMATAGHPPPAIADPRGHVTFPDLPVGTPLGLGMVPFEAAEIDLVEGSVLAFYTDGLIEIPDHDIDAGMNRLRAALASPGRPLDELCSVITDTVADKPPDDDVTLLLARTRTVSPSRVASWELPTDPAVVSHARSLATRQLGEWGLQDLATTTELIVSELLTNAIRYGTDPIRLRLIFHQVLTCEVSDTSDSSPRLRHARTTDEGGRGLFLVAQMCHRWGTRYTLDGKVVWAEQELDQLP